MRLDDTDVARIIALMREVAAAEIMPRFGRLRAGEVRGKAGPLDPVTVADEAAEAALAAGLKRMFPDTVILGEEAASADPALFGLLQGEQPVFVIDPIDGTANYAAGLPVFGVMIALVAGGRTEAGFIHDPWRDDTAVAVRGGGAFLVRRDGGRTQLAVAPETPLREMVASFSWRYMDPEVQRSVLMAMPRFGSTIELRCAAQSYRMLAMGQCHAGLAHRTLPWDHAAGVLIFEEAGGYVAKLDGTSWRPGHLRAGLLVTRDEATWRMVRRLFETE